MIRRNPRSELAAGEQPAASSFPKRLSSAEKLQDIFELVFQLLQPGTLTKDYVSSLQPGSLSDIEFIEGTIPRTAGCAIGLRPICIDSSNTNYIS